MNKYIHYGADTFDKTKFTNIVNVDHDWAKPKSGGLWASRIDAEYGWVDWCRDNEFKWSDFTKSFTFQLSKTAKVCHLYSIKDLDLLPQRKPIVISSYYLIDYEKASEKYDAIELHLSEEHPDDYVKSLYFKLYGWDCDSILILNPDIIEVTK